MAQLKNFSVNPPSSSSTSNSFFGPPLPRSEYRPTPALALPRGPSLQATPMRRTSQSQPPNQPQHIQTQLSGFGHPPIIRMSTTDEKSQLSSAASATSVKGEDHDPNLEGSTRTNRPPPVISTAPPARRFNFSGTRDGDQRRQKGHGRNRDIVNTPSSPRKGKRAHTSGPAPFHSGVQQPHPQGFLAVRTSAPPTRKILDFSLTDEEFNSDMDIDEIDAFSGDSRRPAKAYTPIPGMRPLKRYRNSERQALASVPSPPPHKDSFVARTGTGIRYNARKPTFTPSLPPLATSFNAASLQPPSAPRVVSQEPLRNKEHAKLLTPSPSSLPTSNSASTSKVEVLQRSGRGPERPKRSLEPDQPDATVPAKRRRALFETKLSPSNADHSLPDGPTGSGTPRRPQDFLGRQGFNLKPSRGMTIDRDERSWPSTGQPGLRNPFPVDGFEASSTLKENMSLPETPTTAEYVRNTSLAPSQVSQPNDAEVTKATFSLIIKEEPSPPRPLSPIDVDAPPLSLYEQLGLPQRTSGALRVPKPRFGPHATAEKQCWSKGVADSIKWVRGNGVLPLHIGKIFWRPDGVSFDWRVPPEELIPRCEEIKNAPAASSAETLPIQKQSTRSPKATIPQASKTRAWPASVERSSTGVGNVPSPPTADNIPAIIVKEEVVETPLSFSDRSPAVNSTGPYPTSDPSIFWELDFQAFSSLCQQDLPHTPSLLATPPSPSPSMNPAFESPDALSNIATCFLDRYTRCFDHVKSRTKLSEAYATDAFMSIQFNDLPSEGSCPRVGQPKKQSHAIVNYAERELGRNLLLESDRDSKHREYKWRTNTALSTGSQAIALRLVAFEEFSHTPSLSSSRAYRFVATPLKELGLLVLEYSGELYATKAGSHERYMSLRFQRTFVLRPNEPEAPSWIDWPWVVTNDQMTLFHRPGIVCQCPP